MPEGNLFECPSCGAPLSPVGNQAQVKCPYCGSIVTVPPELRQADPAASRGANPISIVMNGAGTSIQVSDLSALHPNPVSMVLGDSPIIPQTETLVSPSTNRWLRIGIATFVILMVASFVIPLVCSMCGIFGGLAGSFAPFFVR